jgi:3-dehydrosphinganine reductase
MAGMVLPGYFHQLGPEVFVNHMAVNYFGTLNTIRLTLPTMIDRKSGTITCISSAAGLIGLFGYSAYAPTKFAIRGLCETLRMELKPHDIHVAAVYPADVDTPQLRMEEPRKPPELRAISGTVTPMSADTVAAEILRGVERRRSTIIPGSKTRLLCAAARLAPGLMNYYADYLIATARRNK